jgi:hypothetical protein
MHNGGHGRATTLCPAPAMGHASAPTAPSATVNDSTWHPPSQTVHMRIRPTLATLAALSSAAVVLAGCGSSGSSSTTSAGAHTATTTVPASTTTGSSTTASGNVNSCTVVTTQEAAAALGQSVTTGVLGTATVEGGLACVFYGASSPTPHTPNIGQPDSVRVVVVKGPNATKWYNAYKSSAVVRPQAVTGYGDQAFYDGYASLSVLKGDTYLRVAVVPAGAAPSLAAEQQLAAAILPRL